MKRLLTAPLLTVWVACGGDGAGAPTSTITVGTVIDRSGSNYTASWVHATDLAFADMNAALRQAAHRNLQFANASADNQSIATVAVEKAKELVRSGGPRPSSPTSA